MSTFTFVPVSSVVVGDAIVERDGYLLAVTAIERNGSLVTFKLANDFSPIRAWRSDGEGLTLRKRATSRIAVVRGADRDVVPGAV